MKLVTFFKKQNKKSKSEKMEEDAI